MLVACRLPVYPRSAHTMRASNDAQCGAKACVRSPRSVARRAEIARAVEKVIEVAPQGWADRRGGCAARPLRWCKKEGNGRLRRVGTEGLLRSERALSHGDNARYPIRAFLQWRTVISGRYATRACYFMPKNRQYAPLCNGALGGRVRAMSRRSSGFLRPLDQAPLQGPQHPLALQLEGAVGLGHQHLDDGARAPVAERVELAVGERKGRFGPAGSGGAVSFVIVILLCGLMRIRRPQLWTHAVVRATMRRRVRDVPPAPFSLRQKKRTGGEGASEQMG